MSKATAADTRPAAKKGHAQEAEIEHFRVEPGQAFFFIAFEDAANISPRSFH